MQFNILNHCEMTDFEQNILNRIENLIIEGKLSNEFLVKNIKLNGEYLGLKTKSDYARDKKISYPGVKDTKTRSVIDLFNVPFVIDNH